MLQDAGGRGLSYAFAINDAGLSVGQSETARGFDAVLWAPSGKATVLQDVGGEGYSQADAINDAGQSVGYSHTAGGGYEAVLWSPKGRDGPRRPQHRLVSRRLRCRENIQRSARRR